MDFRVKLLDCHALLKKELAPGQDDEIIRLAILKDFETCLSQNWNEEHAVKSLNLLIGPFKYLLKNTFKSDLKIKVIECMELLLHQNPITSILVFIELTSLIFLNIYEPSTNGYNQCASEELKFAVLKCGIQIIKSMSQERLLNLYDMNLAHKISLPVLISVQIADKEKNIHLRCAALNYLLTITQHETETPLVFKKVANVFQKLLPGIIKPLQDVLSRDETQNHAIVVKALTSWGHIIHLVMHDEEEKESQVSDEYLVKSWLKINVNDTFDITSALKDNERSKSWIRAAALTLKPLIHKTSNLRSHSHYKVRLELVKVATKLVEHCIINLKEVITPMVEVIVSSLEDGNEEVQRVAQLGLSKLQCKCEEMDKNVFIDLIKENYYTLILELPRILHSGDEKVTYSYLKLLSQYLKLLGNSNKFCQVLCSLEHLKKLITVLSIAAEFEISQEVSEKELTVMQDDLPWKTYKVFKNIIDQTIIKKVEEICQFLAVYGDLETIVDYLSEDYQRKSGYRKEVLFILNEVIARAKDLQENVVRHLLEIYLDPENLYLPLEIDENEEISLKEARSNIIEVSLLMEGIGKLAMAVGEHFQNYILKTLYYVVEKVGCSYCAVRRAATISAKQISRACGYGGEISVLIQKNIDYLTYHLTMKIKRADTNNGVFDVVSVVMKNSPMDAVHNIEEIVNNVLKSSAERFESPNTLAYLRLFRTFTVCVIKWMNPVRHKNEIMTFEKECDIDDLVKYIENKNIKLKEDDEQDHEPIVETENMSEEEIEEDKKKPLPKHLAMCLAIGRHCLHFLPSKDRDKKILTLEILNDCVIILGEHEDELLPLVHEIWSPLVNRFDKIVNPLIIERSFTLLCTLCDTSKDFIRSRTLREVLPTLTAFLRKSSEESKLKDSGSGYFFTQTFKLQKTLLSNLGKLAIDLKLFEKQVDSIIISALPFLNKTQPKVLQLNATSLCSILESYNAYLIWPYLEHQNSAIHIIYKENCQELNIKSFVANTV